MFLVSLLAERGGEILRIPLNFSWALATLDVLMFGHLFCISSSLSQKANLGMFVE